MAPLAKAFAGEIIIEESKAVRGSDITSRILDPRIDQQMRPMGNCARTGACGFIAPIACYTCGSFQAWLGDAEQLIIFKSANDSSHIAARGSIDDVQSRDTACRILEGAREAFTRRAKIYGIR